MRRLMAFIHRVLFGPETKPTFSRSIYQTEDDQLLKQAWDRVHRLKEDIQTDRFPDPHSPRHRP
jgi:hypothetical protein